MKQAHAPLYAGSPAHQPSARSRRRVLLVGATPDLQARLAAQLRDAGHEVMHEETGQAVLSIAPETIPSLILCEHLLSDMFGVLLCNALRRNHPDRHFHFILMGDAGADAALAVQSGGVDDVLPLPVRDGVLRLRIAVAERMLDMAHELTHMNRGLAQTLDNLRAAQKVLDRDLAEARRLQQGLVPERFQQFGPMRVSLLLRPSGQVGGDLIGTFPICRCRLGIYAIDVAGHGVTAALIAARLSAWLSQAVGHAPAPRRFNTGSAPLAPLPGCSAECGAAASPPAEVVGRLNRMMLTDAVTDSYFTMIYLEMNTRTGDGVLVQAGHPNPIRQAADGTVQAIGQGGMPVGLLEDAEYDPIRFRLHPGERLFIASDGLIEAENPQGDLLGEAGLMASMQINAQLSGQAFLESLCWSVSRYTEGRQEDDISAVLIEFKPDLIEPEG